MPKGQNRQRQYFDLADGRLARNAPPGGPCGPPGAPRAPRRPGLVFTPRERDGERYYDFECPGTVSKVIAGLALPTGVVPP
jgi:hypothetical protein